MDLKKRFEASHTVQMFKKYNYLLLELTRKNIKLKYRDSWLGILWTFIQPLLNMIVLSVIFTNIFAGKRGDIICYPVYLFTGRLMFEFFTGSTKKALTSFRSNAPIIKKVYVPKYMFPVSGIFSNFVTFAISLLCYIFVWVFFKLTGISGGHNLVMNWHVLLFFIPMFILLIFVTGIGLILSVLQVYFRDIEYIWEVFCTLLFYMIPIIYPIEQIREGSWTLSIIKINPLYSILELFRQCVLYCETMNWKMLVYSFVASCIVLLLGIWVFNKKSDDLIFHM